jgi:four helix bundle protein
MVGHQKMKIWQNIDDLDIVVQAILKKVPRTEFKVRSQIDGASDSVGSNFVEGYYSATTAEYLRFLSYGKRSLGEVHERVRRLLRKGYIIGCDYDQFNDLAIRTMFMFDRLMQALRYRMIQKEGGRSVRSDRSDQANK